MNYFGITLFVMIRSDMLKIQLL